MSSFDSVYKKIASSLERGGVHVPEPKIDPARHIAPAVAHELNNILAIVQGYADRLLLKHGKDAALEPHLKLISEAARRATLIVRNARANDEAVVPPAPKSPRPAEPVA